MQSRIIHLTSIAPIAVAVLSVVCANPAKAEGAANSVGTERILIASPLDAVAGSLPLSLFGPVEKGSESISTEAPEAALSEDGTIQSTGNEGCAPETTASIYSPAHLEIRTEPTSTDSSDSTEESGLETSDNSSESTTDKIPVAALPDGNDSTPELRGNQKSSEDNDTVGDTIRLSPGDIAQSVPTDTVNSDTRDYDLTPVSLPRRTPSFNRFEGMKYNALYALPSRLFFSAVVDNSLRCETNVFQTASHNRPDMIYRILPNTTLGYALTQHTRVSANYFFLRDQYTKYNNPLSRNFHSVGFQIDQDLYAKGRTTVTAGFFGRALFSNPDNFSDTFFNDLLPSITATRQVGYSTILYGSVLGQIRFREMLSKFQEGDQFYSFGAVHRKGPWTALGDMTVNSNFGNSNLRQGHNNQVIILTEEIARRLPYLRLPIEAYVRCQEIFNMGANANPGYAGFNFRVFGGIRATIAKPAIFPVRLAEK